MPMAIKNILVSLSVDINSSLVTAKYAIYIAKVLQAKLIAVYVVDKEALQKLIKARIFIDTEAMEYERDIENEGKIFLDRFKQMAENKEVPFEGIELKGVVHTEVINKIKETNADLLIMGELKEALSLRDTFYNEGALIFFEAPCPVLVVKNKKYVELLYQSI